MYGAGDVRVEGVPDPAIQEPTDAIVRILRAAICGSDLHPYHGMPATGQGRNMGHEFLGIIEDAGAAVTGLRHGDLVVASFLYQDNTCEFCAEGLQTACPHGGRYGFNGVGGQAEAIRVPQAEGTLVKLPVSEDSALLPGLLTLADVLCTGYHCAVKAGAGPRTVVAVIGDGAVGLSAVIAAKRLGAEQIILLGGNKDRAMSVSSRPHPPLLWSCTECPTNLRLSLESSLRKSAIAQQTRYACAVPARRADTDHNLAHRSPG